MAENIDYENKYHKAKETHSTNSFVVQQTVENNKTKMEATQLNSDYNFNRCQQGSSKGYKTQIELVQVVRVKCKPYICSNC